jgi:crotonobetainyl-CoA:carnitine CoA-transferase CaiB-like acyl-CoA transferase
MTAGATQPLTGVRVIDFSQVMLGPCATQMLADYGADVIKIERPAGDLSRSSLADDPDGPNNPVFRSLNRNKRSIVLDLGKPEGKEVIYDLVRDADVVVNNFRAGVMERLGFGYDALAAINPRIITAFGSGFGRAGPLAHKGGQDILAQALSGLIARKPNADDPYAIYSTALCDYTAGMHLTQAILLALLQREKTGKGQEVAVSLFESALAMQMQEAAMWTQRGQHFSWGAFPLTGVFATKDGAIVLVGAFKAHPLRDISTALGVEDLSLDQRFSTFAGQMAHKKELHAIFRERFASGTTEHWLGRLEAQDLLCAPVLTLAEALDHEQSRVNGSVISLNGGSMRVMGTPLSMAPSSFALRHPPPALGAHGEEVLGEIGYSAERIALLKESGVLK